MGKLFLMTGIPGSGKSTWLKNNVSEMPNSIIISRDAIRFGMLNDMDSYFSQENRVWKEFVNSLVDALDKYDYVFADATHLNTRARLKVLNALESRHAHIDERNIIYIRTSLEVALAQNNRRTGRALVPEDVIENMFGNFEQPTLTDNCDWNEIWVINGKYKQVYRRF